MRIVSCLSSDVTTTIAAAYATSLLGTTSPTNNFPFKYVRARRYSATQMMYTVFYSAYSAVSRVDNGAKIRIRNNVGLIRTQGWLGWNGSAPTVRIIKGGALTRGSGKYLTQLGRYEVMGIGGPLSISQRYTGSVPPLAASSVGRVNSSAFLPSILNYPTGSVQFLGADYSIVVPNGAASIYDVTYEFTCSITANVTGFPTITGIPVGGLIHSTTQPNGGADGDWVGSGGPTTYNWSELGITATYPSNDAFAFTAGWSQ